MDLATRAATGWRRRPDARQRRCGEKHCSPLPRSRRCAVVLPSRRSRRARRRRLPGIDRRDHRRALPDVVDRSGTDPGKKAGRQPSRPAEPMGRSGTGDGSAKRTLAIHSSRRRSRSSAKYGGHRCSTGHSHALACSSAPGAGSAASAASPGRPLLLLRRALRLRLARLYADVHRRLAHRGRLGLLLWAVLATEARPRRRTWFGLAGFRHSSSRPSSAIPTS